MFKNLKKLIFAILLLVSWSAFSETIIPPNSYLYIGQSISSQNNNYFLAMQTDGNLVLYRRGDNAVRFATYKFGNNFAAMQSDGNFVVYSSNQPVWYTNTWGNPGAVLSVQNDGNLVLYSSANVPLWQIGPDGIIAKDPIYPGDVVGRDLADAGVAGPLGHLGLWDGASVAEAGPSTTGNAIHFSSLSSFKKPNSNPAPYYWGTASANIPNYAVYFCFAPHCTNFQLQPWGQIESTTSRLAIAKRAYQSYLIGADYAYSATYRPTYSGDYFNPAQRGSYRCDTFVYDTLGITVNNYNNNYQAPINATWSSRYGSLSSGLSLISPQILFDKLKTFN